MEYVVKQIISVCLFLVILHCPTLTHSVGAKEWYYRH